MIYLCVCECGRLPYDRLLVSQAGGVNFLSSACTRSGRQRQMQQQLGSNNNSATTAWQQCKTFSLNGWQQLPRGCPSLSASLLACSLSHSSYLLPTSLSSSLSCQRVTPSLLIPLFFPFLTVSFYLADLSLLSPLLTVLISIPSLFLFSFTL